jgi:hypothetical protein
MPSLSEDAAAPKIGELAPYPAIRFDGTDNLYDAAISELDPAVTVDPAIVDVGTIALPVVPAAEGMGVLKRGAATQRTTGTIDGVNENVDIMYEDEASLTAHFVGQIAIVGRGGSPFSADGDSGSLILSSSTLQPVALLLGGTTNVTGGSRAHSFASPIQPILDRFGVTIVAS